jgi:hypothetical protein
MLHLSRIIVEAIKVNNQINNYKMKKFTLIFAFLMSVSVVVMAQPQLSWRFANYQVINAGTQLQFDVEVKADVSGTFHRDLQIYFDYNTTAFGADIVLTGALSYTPLTLMDDPAKYDVVNMADNTSSKFAIITEAINEMDETGSSTYYIEVTDTYQGLLQFTLDILPGTNTEMCGISFDQALMDGGQYYQSTSVVEPVKYAEPCIYEGDISTMKLSTLYGNLTYGSSGLPIEDCTVTIKQGATIVGTAVTDASGNYTYSGIDDGAFTIETTCTLSPGGATSQDLFLMNQYLLLTGSLDDLQKLAGDLNWDGPGTVTGSDLFIMNQYLLLVVPGWSWSAPDWVFEVQDATVSSGIGNSDYVGLCSGDVNGSYSGF